MPSKTPAQAKLMRAVAHGWRKPGGGGPSPAVAKEFVAADRIAEMYEGGLAPMNDITQRGFAPGLTGTVQGFPEGGPVEVLEDYGAVTEDHQKILDWDLGKGGGPYHKMLRQIQDNLRAKYGLSAPATNEPVGVPADRNVYGPNTGSGGPRGRRGRGGGGRGRGNTGIGADDTGGPLGGPGGRGGGPGGGPGGDWPQPDDTCESGFRGRLGNCRPPPGGGPGGTPPRIIPPTTPPGGIPPGTPPGPYVPPDPRQGRDTEYSDAIRAHRARIAASLAVPPGGFAGGGPVRYYQEGGAVRPGHAEGANPYPAGTARHKLWERKHHVDPPPPPPKLPPPEELSWLERIMGKKEDSESRTERELEEMEQARGGYIHQYANGGLAQASGFSGPPRGGVPPTIKPQMPPIDPRMMPPGGGATTQPVQPPMDPRAMPPQGMPMQHTTGGPGKPPPIMTPPQQRRLPMNPRGVPVPRGMPPERGGPGPEGGPQMPPNMRGMLQRMRMSNRPRRGFSGPAGAGGAPQNRVGQSDQQGGLARALQRGTGRPPMSRRSGSFQ